MEKKKIDFEKIESLVKLLEVLRSNNVPESERWQYVSKYQSYKAQMKGVPLAGHFELTPFCNLDCKMCYIHLNKEQLNDKQLLSVDQWKDIMLQAHKMGMRHACLSGGECLTYPGFKELYLFLLNMGVTTSVKTNGVLLNDDIFRFFEKYPPRELCLSLYGSSEEAYEKVTGSRVFQRVAANLIELKNAKYQVTISITPNEYMADDIESLLKYVHELGITYHLNYGLLPPRENTGRVKHDMPIEKYVETILLFKRLHGEISEPKVTIDLPDSNKVKGKERFGLQCAAGKSSFSVTWDGTLCACTSLDNIREELFTQSFEEAWKKINRIVKQYPLPSECPDCLYYDVCMQCAAYHNDLNNPGRCNPYICQKTKAYVKAGIAKLPDKI